VKLRTLLLIALAAACTPSSFEKQCSVKNKKTPGVTLRGVFLRETGDLLYECDEKTTFRGQKAQGRGCPLSLWTKEGGKRPTVEVFFHRGTAQTNMRPFPESFDWNKDIHVVAEGGDVDFGDVVEITGTLDTSYGDCSMVDVTNVKLIENRYGPGS
jgi:hypothetical protein